MAEVKITVMGFNKLQRKFNQLAKQLRNKEPMFKGIGIKLLNEINETFEKESFEGSPWERLKQSTIFARPGISLVEARKGTAEVKILQNTGTLRRSYSPGDSESRYSVSKNFVRVGTNLEYAAIHEFGIGSPKRQMIPSKKRALEIAIPVANFFVNRSLRSSRLI